MNTSNLNILNNDNFIISSDDINITNNLIKINENNMLIKMNQKKKSY